MTSQRRRESRARCKIREVANRYEFVVEDIEWTPIGRMIEMQGRSGGWAVWTDQGVVTFFAVADAEATFALHRRAFPTDDRTVPSGGA